MRLVALALLVVAGCGRTAIQTPWPPLDGAVPADLTADAADASHAPRIVGIIARSNHTCARYDDGAVYCWGSNQFYELGTVGHDTNSTLWLTIGSISARRHGATPV